MEDYKGSSLGPHGRSLDLRLGFYYKGSTMKPRFLKPRCAEAPKTQIREKMGGLENPCFRGLLYSAPRIRRQRIFERGIASRRGFGVQGLGDLRFRLWG